MALLDFMLSNTNLRGKTVFEGMQYMLICLHEIEGLVCAICDIERCLFVSLVMTRATDSLSRRKRQVDQAKSTSLLL